MNEDVCPLCCLSIGGHGALSRIDNKTKVCSRCGVAEALDPIAVRINREEMKKAGFSNYRQYWEAKGIE